MCRNMWVHLVGIECTVGWSGVCLRSRIGVSMGGEVVMLDQGRGDAERFGRRFES